MTQVIDRTFINPKIEYYDGDGLRKHTFADLADEINYWKILLYEGYGLRKGNIISLFDTTIRLSYSTLFIAAAELGLVMISPPDKAASEDGRTSRLDKMLGQGKIDLVLIDDSAASVPAILAMAEYYSKRVARKTDYNNYEIKDHELYNHLARTTFCEPNDVLVIATSSGTTGTPKMISYTHQQLRKIAVRNADVYGFDGTTVCHTRNLHHAFVLMISFLPTLHACNRHYTNVVNSFSPKSVEEFANLIIKNQVNKLVIPYKHIMDTLIDHMVATDQRFEHTIDLYVGGFYVTPDYVKKLKQVNGRSIGSGFGSNETFGPVFMRTLTQNTDTTNYVLNNIGVPPDNFFDLQLDGEKLSVSCAELYPDTHIMGDVFSKNLDGSYCSLGRSNHYRINDIDFSILSVSAVAKQHCTGVFDVLVDQDYQRLYLVTWTGTVDLDQLNQAMLQEFGRLEINAVKALDPVKFNQDFKVDFDVIRDIFRKDFV